MSIPEHRLVAELVEFRKPYKVHSIAVPDVPDHLILIQMKAAGFCHSDLQLIEGQYPSLLPIIASHEPVGVVAAVGKAVHGVTVGDRVGMGTFFGTCRVEDENKCVQCAAKRYQYCLSKRRGCPGISRPDVDSFVPNGDGGFGEYALADPQWTVPLPSDMSFPELAPLMCAGSTAYGAILNAIEGAPTEEKPDGGRFPGVSKGGWIAMVGIGGLGILGVQMAKAMGYKVVAIDARQEPLDYFDSISPHLRPDLAILATAKDLLPRIYERTMPEQNSIDKDFFKGVSASIVFTDSSKAFETATSVLRMQGRLVMAGLPEKPAPLLTADLCFKGIHVVGVYGSTFEDYRDMIQIVGDHKITLPVKTYRLEQVNDLVEDYNRGEHIGRLCISFE